MTTYYASVERAERRTLESQIKYIGSNPIMNTLLKATGSMLVILNDERQIVGINEVFLESLGVGNATDVLGLRLGETLSCTHAFDSPNGCGTTEYCRSCGAAIAMVAAITENKTSEQTCALQSEKNGITIERYLAVRAHPLDIEQKRWILIYAQDITHQHYLSMLEKAFFHDINNILTAIIGHSEVLAIRMPEDRSVQQIGLAAVRLHAEIALQKLFSSQKGDNFSALLKQVGMDDIRESLDFILGGHAQLRNKVLKQFWPDGNLLIKTDIQLASRVLANMVINALEATPDNGTVCFTTTLNNDSVLWEVWNDSFIPEDIQLRIFQKHFSTKSSMGRGIGTHSMKLLGEKLLNGVVNFNSSPSEGTTFRFKLPLYVQ